MTQETHGALYEIIGQRLRSLRIERGLTQAEAARLIAVSPQQYQKYEDAYSKCSLNNLAILAAFYGVSLGVIVAPAEAAVGPVGQLAVAREPVVEDLPSRLLQAYLDLPEKMDKMRFIEMLDGLRSIGL